MDENRVVWVEKAADAGKLLNGNSMTTVKPDPSRNLLVIKFSGHVESHEVQQHIEEIEAALKTLQPGFRLLTDLSELEFMEYAAATYIRQAMDKQNAHGVAVVVRVVPDPRKDIGFRMLSYFHYGRDVRIITCETVLEADTALAT